MALEVLRKRGVEIRLKTTLDQVGPDWVRFTGGEWVPTSTVVWTAGVTPDPLVGKLGLATDERGRVVVDEYLAVPGRDDVFAVGDAAAVPIAGRPGATAPPTAQHALRQAWACGDNIAAALGVGERRPFAFKGLGLLVNLSERYGVARVLGVPVSGLLGWVVTRSYHLLALPTWTRRLRVGLDWAVAAVFPRDVAELGTLGHPEPLPGDDVPPRPPG
jgi:NADH dehydrogenase